MFLYVERFCDDVQRGHLSLDRPEQFPQGLGGIFFQYFQRQLPDLEQFRKNVRPALRAILAAREPLPVEILQRLFNWQDEELCDFTRPLGSLFPVTTEAGHEVIKPYHKSLADWLVDDAKAGPYFVSVVKGHRMLAAQGKDMYGGGLQRLPTYFIRHLPQHLHESEDFEPLYCLLRDEGYTTMLGSDGYQALPDVVRLWAPDDFRYFPADKNASYWKKEGGRPGDWRIVELDGVPPDYIWVACVRCGWLGDRWNGMVSLCPNCGWEGNEKERQAFAELVARNAALQTGDSK